MSKNISHLYQKTPCSNCPFKKDTQKGWLGSERMKEIIHGNSFTCHKNEKKQCAGFMNLQGKRSSFVMLAERFNIPLELTGREKIFASAKECIEHHG